MASKGKDRSLAASVAGALIFATSTAADEEVPRPDVPRRPDTSSFHFASTFQGENALRTGEWVLSEDEKYDGQASRVRVEPCNLEGGRFATDYGLLLDESHKHYAVGATLAKPYDNAGKDLVMQYEVQVRDGAKCGGAYVKMLRGPAGENMEELNNDSPYSVMFGPDKCFRDTNKVHFIFQHENPLTNKWEEKHYRNTPKIKDDNGFHVYTLHVKTDGTFDLYIDTEIASSGNLLEDMEPPIMPPKEIDDPDDVQPEDWVTEAKMADPSAVKPDDWDEDLPQNIVDESAEKPAGWLDDEEMFIPNPSSSMPDDWDEEEDGDWEPVLMANPVCVRAPGCGPWEAPMIPNPDYKGVWKPPKIPNPDYKGPWSPRRIANPEYFETSQPSDMAPITGLAVEVWSVDGGVWLDNFAVGDDINAALKLAEDTWRPKFVAHEAVVAAEKKQKKEKEDKLAEKKKKKNKDAALTSRLSSAVTLVVDKARPYLPESAAPALKMAEQNPAACLGSILAGLLAVLMLSMRKKSKPLRSSVAATAPARNVAADAPNTREKAVEREGEEEGEGEQEEEEEQEIEGEEGVEGEGEEGEGEEGGGRRRRERRRRRK
eukprot:jgi/Undpi1/14286/HiC_scaffold_9.g03935.m1